MINRDIENNILQAMMIMIIKFKLSNFENRNIIAPLPILIFTAHHNHDDLKEYYNDDIVLRI